jgi:hypothetical protein
MEETDMTEEEVLVDVRVVETKVMVEVSVVAVVQI